MENETKTKTSLESLNNKKLNKNINSHMEEEEIKNNSDGNEINFDKTPKNNQLNIEKNTNIELNEEHSEYKNINKEETTKKFINNRVNNILNDIYGSLSNINEVNNKVKNILSQRKKVNSVNSFRNSMIEKKDNTSKNKKKSFTIYKNKTNYNIKTNNIPEEVSMIKKININDRNISYNDNDITKIQTGTANTKSKKNVIHTFNQLNNNSKTKENKIEVKNKAIFYYKNSSQEKDNLLEKKSKNKINLKLYKYDDLINEDNTTKFDEKNDEFSNINKNFGIYDEEFENEKIIRYMRLKLRNEENKLRVLEEQKNKLLNEEKIRRQILMEKIKNKNKLKKQNLINQYKNKISLIQKLQTNNINEIRKLEIKKKIDEENIVKVEKMCEDMNINDSFLTKSRTEKSQRRENLSKSKLDFSSERSDYLFSENNPQKKYINKKYLTNFHIFSNNNKVKSNKKKMNNYNTESEGALTEEYQFNNSINELTSTCDNAEENESFSNSQETKYSSYRRKLNLAESGKSIKQKKENINPFNYLFNYYQKINQSNNRKNYKDEKKNIYNYLSRNNKNRKYHSETRQYTKSSNNSNSNTTSRRKSKVSLTPNQDVISFIQARVNKYNHSSNKDSYLPKKYSQKTANPSYLKYNLNCKYNYKYSPFTASNARNFNHMQSKNSQRSGRNKPKKIKELNFKYIFFNHN